MSKRKKIKKYNIGQLVELDNGEIGIVLEYLPCRGSPFYSIFLTFYQLKKEYREYQIKRILS